MGRAAFFVGGASPCYHVVVGGAPFFLMGGSGAGVRVGLFCVVFVFFWLLFCVFKLAG